MKKSLGEQSGGGFYFLKEIRQQKEYPQMHRQNIETCGIWKF